MTTGELQVLAASLQGIDIEQVREVVLVLMTEEDGMPCAGVISTAHCECETIATLGAGITRIAMAQHHGEEAQR